MIVAAHIDLWRMITHKVVTADNVPFILAALHQLEG